MLRYYSVLMKCQLACSDCSTVNWISLISFMRLLIKMMLMFYGLELNYVLDPLIRGKTVSKGNGLKVNRVQG